jgi:hypothetical protein
VAWYPGKQLGVVVEIAIEAIEDRQSDRTRFNLDQDLTFTWRRVG